MKILVLCRDFPLPLTTGEKIRCYHIIKGLAQSNEVYLLSLIHRDEDLKFVAELQQFCKKVFPIKLKFAKKSSALKSLLSSLPWDTHAYYSEEFKSTLKTIFRSENFDLIWVNFLSMSIYLNDEIVAKTTCVLDQHNVDELVWSDYSKYSNSLAMKIFSTINFYKVKKYQRNIIRYFSTIVCVSPDDAEYMQRIIPQNVKTWVVPNGVDTEYFRPNFSKGNKTNIIMLCASMDVSMNIDAASYFARKIFPAVKLNIPDSEFWIVGRNPAKQVTDLKTAGSIFVTGSVDDVRPYYEKAKVVVAPYRFGGGTKLKILEAMAMNLPIVSTNIGCQGINTAGIEQIVIRDDQGGFAEAVINMLGSSKLNDTIPDSSARAVVCAKYSWESITRNLELKLNELK